MFEGPNDIALARTKRPVVFKPLLVAPVSKTLVNLYHHIYQLKICLGPVADQSKGKRVVTGFIQGFGISGEQNAAQFGIAFVKI